MNTPLRRSVLLLALFFPGCGGGDSPADPARPDARASLEAYFEAVKAGDVERALEFVPEDSRRDVVARLDRDLIKEMLASPDPAKISIGARSERDGYVVFELAAADDEFPVGRVTLRPRGDGWEVAHFEWSNDMLGEWHAPGEPEAVPEPAPREPLPEGEWSLELSGRAIPSRPAAGRIGGRPIRIDRAEFDANLGNLVLAEGEGWKIGEFTIFLFEEEPAGKTFRFPSDQPVTPRVHLVHATEDGGMPEVDARAGGFALELVFGAIRDGKLPGEIYLCVDDAGRSYLAGRFEAVVAR